MTGQRHHRKTWLGAAVLFLSLRTAAAQQASPPPGHRAMAQLPGGNHGPCGSCLPPAPLSSSVVIAPPGEPGEALELRGTVYEPDGITPAVGVRLFFYQTDATGHYNAWDDARDPRLYGRVEVGADGRYVVRTIRPGPYPQRTIPAHIHVTRWSARCTEWFLDDVRFADDPLLSASAKATAGTRYSSVVNATRDAAGTWQAVRDIRLDASCGTTSR